MKVNFVQSLDQQQFNLQVSSLQIDNQLNITPYPVILSFDHGNKGNLVNQVKYKEDSTKMASGSMPQISYREPVFSLAVAKWRNKDTLVSFEHISLRFVFVHQAYIWNSFFLSPLAVLIFLFLLFCKNKK